jgi:hypothetical protein
MEKEKKSEGEYGQSHYVHVVRRCNPSPVLCIPPIYPTNPLPTNGLAAYPFQTSNFSLLALLRSNATCPAVVCFEKLDAGSALLLGTSALSAKPILGAASVALNVDLSARIQFEQRKVYVQCVLLT